MLSVFRTDLVVFTFVSFVKTLITGAVKAFYWALTSFQDAVIRYGKSIEKHYTKRKYTNLEGIVGEEARLKYRSLVTIGLHGNYNLTGALTGAVEHARQTYEVAISNAAATPRQGGARPAPP